MYTRLIFNHVIKLVVVLSFISCNLQTKEKTDNSEIINEIDLIRDAHVDGVNNTDVELVLRDMSDDVIYLGPEMEPLEGKQALRDFITPLYELIRPNIKMIPRDTKIIDDTVIEWGLINGDMAEVGVDTIQKINFKYIFVYEKSKEGKWLITRDIYNKNE